MTDTRDRPIWPLYLLAGLSFIPVLGFFVGSVALSWGLLSTRRGAGRAIAISATGALLNLVLVIVVSITMTRDPAFQQTNLQRIRQDLERVVLALEESHARSDAYPETLEALQRERGPLHPLQVIDLGPGVIRLAMPQQFHYIVAPDRSSYDLFSVGPDGKPGTNDDIRPVIPDSLRDRTGLRPQP